MAAAMAQPRSQSIIRHLQAAALRYFVTKLLEAGQDLAGPHETAVFPGWPHVSFYLYVVQDMIGAQK
jgi:hypothetical protein